MDTSRPQFPRGNKLFLPKIEYAKLTKETQFSGEKSNGKNTVTEQKSSGDFADEQTVPLLDDNSLDSFPKFSVLPPIQKTLQATRRLSHARRRSSGLFSSVNGSSPSTNDSVRTQGDLTRPIHQNGGANSPNRGALQIVGSAYGNKGHKTSKRDQAHFRTNPRRSFSSPGFCKDENGCQDCEALLKRARSRTDGDKLKSERRDTRQISCAKHSTTEHYLRRHNSENLDLQGENRGGVNDTNPSRRGEAPGLIALEQENASNNNLLRLDIHKARPVSRCEISVDMNSGETDSLFPTAQDTRVASKRTSLAPPVIQIHPPTSETVSDVNNHGEDSLSQGTPRIQVLIDSIDIAREELPKTSSGEVPYTSVREKRRRSALCRNNSKQVDDFLLVHNLRDLGLL